MAHEIEIINGKAQMAYVKTDAASVPWHNLGFPLPKGVSPAQMQKAAGLDWRVEKRPDYFKGSDGKYYKTGKYSLVRETDQKFLTTVGEGWNPVQNDEAFEFFQEFCAAGKMDMETAGSLKGGTLVWALAKIGLDFELFNGDRVGGFLLFTNPHQFGKCVDVRFTAIRAVCNNTVTLALNSASLNSIRINHSRQFNPEMVKDALGLASEKLEEFKETAEILGSKRMTDKNFREFLNKVFAETDVKEDKLGRSARQVYELLETQPGAEYARGTWWQGLNAATYFMDHVQGRSVDTRLTNVWFGLGRQKKIKAIQTALEMATA